MNTGAAAKAWVDAWLHAWPTKDPEPLSSLYVDYGVFFSHPFRDPLVGPAGAREYVTWATADQASVECAFGEPIVSGDRAAVEWWGSWREQGQELTFAGVTVLRFDDQGLVVESRDYWHMEPGRREPHATWGR